MILPVGTLGDTARAVAIDPAGRIAVTGTSDRPGFGLGAGVAVLEEDGTPEAAFAEDGTTVIETESGFDDRGEGIAVQEDGKVVVADATGAGAGDGFTIVRLGLDGKPDASFGGDGIVETPIPGEGEVTGGRVSDVVIQPDGKIVGGGYGVDYVGEPPDYITKFALARYTSEGELDESFGNGGIVGVPLPGGDDFGRVLGLAANGKLVLGGTYDPSNEPLEEKYAPAITRFNPDGSLDESFGSGGIVLGPLGGGIEDESLEGLAMQPDGKIVTTGTQYHESGEYLAVVSRYLADFQAEPVSGPPPKPNQPPDTNMRKVPRRVGQDQLTRFRGTASDPDGAVAKVQIALVRLNVGKARASVKPAHWHTAKGKAKWTYKLPHPPAPGRYVVVSRAIDDQGLAETGFSRRDRNRYSFTVR